MDKKFILEKYKNAEDKLLVSKFLDKVQSTIKKGKIEVTDFYNEHEQAIINNVVKAENINYFVLFGGYENASRKLGILYPEKMAILFKNNYFKFDTVFSVFRISLIKEDWNKYNHGIYLGGILKLGLLRSKIGDIITYESGADIIVKKESEKFLFANLKTLNRFSNAQINLINLEDLKLVKQSFEEFKIVTSSLRLDNIVADLVKTSRNKANEFLEQGKVFVNYENEMKQTKQIKINDVISIRGKGKFIIADVVGNTKKGNFVIIIKKYK